MAALGNEYMCFYVLKSKMKQNRTLQSRMNSKEVKRVCLKSQNYVRMNLVSYLPTPLYFTLMSGLLSSFLFPISGSRWPIP